jgi:hypothetical protein
MRFVLVAFIALAQLAAPVVAQHKRQQTAEFPYYVLEEPFSRPVPVSTSVLNFFRGWMKRQKIYGCGQKKYLDADMLSATNIKLNTDRFPELLVKSAYGCLNGADNDWFWVFQNTGRGYHLILFGGAYSVRPLRIVSKGFSDIQTDITIGDVNYTTIYKFNGREYRTVICTETPHSSSKPKRVPCSP